MTAAIAYAIGAMICLGLTDIIYKRAAAANVRPHHFRMVQAWVFAPSILAYAVLSGSLRLQPQALWGSAVGLCSFISFYNFIRSLRTGSISINAPIFRLSFAFTAALAISVLHEPLTPYKIGGLALTLAAVWLLLGSPTPTEAVAPRLTAESLLQVLVATLFLGMSNFIYKVGLQAGTNPASMLVAQASVFVVLATGFAIYTDRGLRPARTVWNHAPPAGIFLLFGLVFMLESLSRGEASVLVPISQMGFVVAAVLGFAVLREPFTARKAAGLVAAIAAIVCLAQS